MPERTRNAGAMSLVSTFLASFPPLAESAQERQLASLPRLREDAVLSVRVEQEGEGVMVHVSGELDIASAKALEDELRHAIDSDASAVVLDLAGLRFIDSAGLRVLVRAAAHSR